MNEEARNRRKNNYSNLMLTDTNPSLEAESTAHKLSVRAGSTLVPINIFKSKQSDLKHLVSDCNETIKTQKE